MRTRAARAVDALGLVDDRPVRLCPSRGARAGCSRRSQDCGTSDEVLRFKAVGLQGSTTDAMVTSSELYPTVRLRVLGGVAAGTGASSRSSRGSSSTPARTRLPGRRGRGVRRPRERELGGAAGGATWPVAGVFAYTSSGTLANLAVLTGAAQQYAVSVASVSDDDRLVDGSATVTGSASCSTSTGASVLGLSGCTVLLDASRTAGSTSASVDVSFDGGAFSASVPFEVYRPSAVSVSAASSVLKRVQAASGESITCGSSVRYSRRASARRMGSTRRRW